MNIRPFVIPCIGCALFAASLPALAGLVPVKPPGKADLERVQAREAAVVLLRVAETVGGKPVAPTQEYDFNRVPRYYLANLDALDAPKQVFPSAPSKPSGQAGWFQFVLAPGAYYLMVLPPGGAQNPPAVAYAAKEGRFGRLTQYQFVPGRGAFYSSAMSAYVFGDSPPPDFRELPGFWFQVPRDGQVVYAGTLSLACKTGRGLFGDLFDSCEDFVLDDESAAARDLAATAFPGLGFDTSMAVPYGKIRGGAPVRVPQDLPVVAGAPTSVGAAFTGAELEPWETIAGVGPAFNLYNLLIVGGHLAHQSAADKRAQERSAAMQPCVDRLSEAVAALDLPKAASTALSGAAAVQPARPATAEAARSAPGAGDERRWSVSLPVLRLRQAGQSGGLGLELVMALRLENPRTGRLDGYALLASGPELPARNPFTALSPLYMVTVPGQAELLPTEQWCGPGGGALLSSEIDKALQRIAGAVVRGVD